MQELTNVQFSRIANDKNYGQLWSIVQHLPNPHKFLVAGGAIRRTISGEKLEDGDIDLFFTNEKDHNEYKEILKKSSRLNIKLVSEKEHVDTFELQWQNTKYEIQLIKIRYYPDAASLLDSFDFTIAQFAMDPIGPRFFCGDFSLYDLGRKRIVINKLLHPLSSLRRLIKYTKQGYYACNGCLAGYLEDVRNIPKSEWQNAKITYID